MGTYQVYLENIHDWSGFRHISDKDGDLALMSNGSLLDLRTMRDEDGRRWRRCHLADDPPVCGRGHVGADSVDYLIIAAGGPWNRHPNGTMAAPVRRPF